jgi:hypothetical protein
MGKKSPRAQQKDKDTAERKKAQQSKEKAAAFALEITDEKAALLIQRLYRTRKARRMVRAMIERVYEKLYDPVSKAYYYFNNKTGESQWSRPAQLRSHDDLQLASPGTTRKSPRQVRSTEPAEDTKARQDIIARIVASEALAASYIQKAFRAKRARAKLLAMLGNVFEKLYDPESELYYYFNNKTGESQWIKPKLLGSKDLNVAPPNAAKESPRAMAKREREDAIKRRQGEERARAEEDKRRKREEDKQQQMEEAARLREEEARLQREEEEAILRHKAEVVERERMKEELRRVEEAQKEVQAQAQRRDQEEQEFRLKRAEMERQAEDDEARRTTEEDHKALQRKLETEKERVCLALSN